MTYLTDTQVLDLLQKAYQEGFGHAVLTDTSDLGKDFAKIRDKAEKMYDQHAMAPTVFSTQNALAHVASEAGEPEDTGHVH